MINQDRLVKTLTDLIKIDSPSGEEEKVAKEVKERLQVLGCRVQEDKFGNIIAKLKGDGEPILLEAHLDTVEPGRNIKPIINGDTIHSDGKTILGADPKAGISIILEVLQYLKESQQKHLPLEIVLTREEEIGLNGARNLDYSLINAKYGLILDGDEEVHKVFKSGPGYIRIDAIITGRAAHAGVAPEKGISSIEIASKIISKLKLGRLDFETTANIGQIQGGSARNAVPQTTHLKGEIRSLNKKKLLKQAERVQKIFDSVMLKYPEAKIHLELEEEFSGYRLTPEHKTVKLISDTLKNMDIEPLLLDSGGGTDANIFHTHGIEVVVVGTGVWDLHTTSEYLVIPQFIQAAQFVEKLVSI